MFLYSIYSTHFRQAMIITTITIAEICWQTKTCDFSLYAYNISWSLVGDTDVTISEGEIETQTVDSTSTDLMSSEDKRPRHNISAHINEDDAIPFISESFSDCQNGKVHSFYLCKKNKCSNLSTDEIKLFSTNVDRFQHAWIMDKKLTFCERTGYHWLIYEEGHGMFCFICRKHNMENARNKCKKFNVDPGV